MKKSKKIKKKMKKRLGSISPPKLKNDFKKIKKKKFQNQKSKNQLKSKKFYNIFQKKNKKRLDDFEYKPQPKLFFNKISKIMNNKTLFSLLFVLLLCAHFAQSKSELRFVFSMFRHGAREPTGVHGGVDDFGEKWSHIGELTPAGKRMQYLLGLRNRHVYANFTTSAREDGSVYIRSTDYNRTIESVEAQMHGMFPPGSAVELKNDKVRDLAHPFIDDPQGHGWLDNSWSKELNKQTIKDRVETFPIHLFERNNPLYAFFYNPYPCAPIKGMSKANIAGEKIQSWMKKFKADYGEKWMKMTGNNSTADLDNYWYVFKLIDSYISDIYDGRELKHAKEHGIDLKAMNETAFEFVHNDILIQFNGDPEGFFARWTASVMWPEVIYWMEKRIEADNNGHHDDYHGYQYPRFAFFSTHDVTVGSGLTVLNRAFGFKKYYTPFASDIFFELWRNENGEYHVTVKYQSLTLGTVPFSEFKEKLEAQFYTFEEIQKRCEMHIDEIFLHPTWSRGH